MEGRGFSPERRPDRCNIDVGARAEAKTTTLTALDYAEIGQLVNRYGQAIDTCSNNGYDYADLYTPDGVFIDKITPNGFAKGGVVLAKGREQLAEVVGGGSFGCKRPTKGPTSTPATDRWHGTVGATSCSIT